VAEAANNLERNSDLMQLTPSSQRAASTAESAAATAAASSFVRCSERQCAAAASFYCVECGHQCEKHEREVHSEVSDQATAGASAPHIRHSFAEQQRKKDEVEVAELNKRVEVFQAAKSKLELKLRESEVEHTKHYNGQ
jgi:hypothetical protein